MEDQSVLLNSMKRDADLEDDTRPREFDTSS